MNQSEFSFTKFTNDQKRALKKANVNLKFINESDVFQIVNKQKSVKSLSDDQLVEFLNVANATYRDGNRIISDEDYDFIYIAELGKRNPEHPYLQAVEPESTFEGKTVELPVEMLSTEKAYSREDILRWLDRIIRAGAEVGVKVREIIIRGTAKLDGFAAYDDGQRLYTRGDGRRGTDISRVFERGLAVADRGERGQGAGEIVVTKTYFHQYLADKFDNSRNLQASIIREKELDPLVEEAIIKKAAVFFPFSSLPFQDVTAFEFPEKFDDIVSRVVSSVDYDVDGVIFETINGIVKHHMGATRSHHRWQIAYKENLERSETKVLNVRPQTSRTGRVNPVAELEPVRLCGATIKNATAHHYGMVRKLGIGPGAKILLVRSGKVIPKIEKVLEKAGPQVPAHCPSCGEELCWEKDFLYCTNSIECPAQIENTIQHFFKTIGTADGFGPKNISVLFKNGVRSIREIYELTRNNLVGFGFGEKQSQNLIDQLDRSRREPLEDWRFLAAMGVYRLGPGMCERLLQYFKLDDVFNLEVDELKERVEGFEETTAKAAVKGLQQVRDLFNDLNRLGFNLQHTQLITEGLKSSRNSPISGKRLVFSGAMVSGSREDVKRQARVLGAKVGGSVTGKIDFLVIGESPGDSKVDDATRKNVPIISEEEYLKMIEK